jgi:hypothetical protein
LRLTPLGLSDESHARNQQILLLALCDAKARAALVALFRQAVAIFSCALVSWAVVPSVQGARHRRDVVAVFRPFVRFPCRLQRNNHGKGGKPPALRPVVLQGFLL